VTLSSSGSRSSAVRLVRALVLALAAAPGLAGQQAPAPSTPSDTPPFFNWKDAVVAGGFVVGAIGFAELDRPLAHTLQSPSLQESRLVKDGATFFKFMGQPAPEVIGAVLYGAGRLTHKRPIAALGLHGLEALLLSAAITTTIKDAAGRARPYVHADTVTNDFEFLRGLKEGHDYQSFPSGHTATAFAVAATATGEAMHWAEEKKWSPVWQYAIGGTLFGGATLVGVSRMYHDQHWASDVIGGAAVGIFSGFKVVKYAYRHPQNRFDRWLLPIALERGADGSTVFAWTHAVR
jgi:membrane-associated phospholipid phosphatase